MYLVSVYDISCSTKKGKRRLPKVMKKFRQYLHHTQKSVFEGEITEAKFAALKQTVKELIDDKEDYVVFFIISNKNNIKRENIGLDFDPTSTFI